MKTTWKQQLEKEFIKQGETWDSVEASTFSDEQLNREFDNGYGGSEGCAFTLWTRARVYFPAVYDGAEWVESVSRNPSSEAKEHVGGE